LHEVERRLEKLQVLLVFGGTRAIDLDPLARSRHPGGLERGHVLARELELARHRDRQPEPHAVAADAGEHAVVHEVAVEPADLLRDDARQLHQHGVDLGLAGGLGVVGFHDRNDRAIGARTVRRPIAASCRQESVSSRRMRNFNEAIAYAQAHEVPWPRDPAADPAHWGVHQADPPPFNRLRGPVHERGGVAGVIDIRGEEVAAWGDPHRADLTFSVAKTYLALLAGIAHARGLLRPDERLSERLPGIGFDSPHNRAITWEHLLTQTSEWEGVCFGIPDQVDRYRQVAHDPKPVSGKKGDKRPLHEPGTYWEYNDVRINQLALALLHLFRRPLPEIFMESVLTPLGGSANFRWE